MDRMWKVETTRQFDAWFAGLGEIEKIEIDALVGALKLLGPQLKRPHADTLNGSSYANMKELRGKTAGSVLRIAFAFDPLQTGILLAGGDKTGVSEKHFYQKLIAKADELYKAHLLKVEQRKKQQTNLSVEQREALKHKKRKGKGK
jgi:hypothetical protein